MNFTSIVVETHPPIFDDTLAGWTGNIWMCTRVHNPNEFKVWGQKNYEIYRVVPGTQEMRRVYMAPSPPRSDVFIAGYEGSGGALWHFVHADELAGNTSAQYAVHIWHEIMERVKPGNPRHYLPPEDELGPHDPPLREDRWFNITYVPYTRTRLVHEGRDC